MRLSAYVFLLAATVPLAGCVAGSSPVWLDAGKINMAKYQNARVVVLPSELNSLYKLDDGQLQAIQEHVRASVERVFEIEQVEALPSAVRAARYPYTQSEVSELAALYNADAAVGVSVYWYRRRDQYGPETLGIKIIFADANDADKGWTASRDYKSDFGYLATSSVLGDSIVDDLSAVKTALRHGHPVTNAVARTASLGLYGRKSAGPSLSVTSPLMSQDRAEELGKTLETVQSRLDVYISAQDEDGVGVVTVTNKAAEFEEDFGVGRQPQIQRPQQTYARKIANEHVSVPLVAGRNDIVIKAVNGRNKITVRKMTAFRTVRREIYSLSVGVDQFEMIRDLATDALYLARQFHDSAAVDASENFFLSGSEATRDGIMLGILELDERTHNNESGLGVFYFAGQLVAINGEDLLVTYDFIPEYPSVTGVSVDFLAKIFKDQGHVILDLCAPEQASESAIREKLPSAVVSYKSCFADQATLANRISHNIEEGMSLQDAIKLVALEVGEEPPTLQ
jgi:hypothetical protein